MNVNAVMPAPAGPEISVAKVEQKLFDQVTSGLERPGNTSAAAAQERVANQGREFADAKGERADLAESGAKPTAAEAEQTHVASDLKGEQGKGIGKEGTAEAGPRLTLAKAEQSEFAQVTSDLQGTGGAALAKEGITTASASPDAAFAKAEQNLFDHVASGLERRGGAIGKEAMANPGNLLGEAMGDLKGYLDRVRVMGGMFAQRDPNAKHGGGTTDLARATRPKESIMKDAAGTGSEGGAKARIDDNMLDQAARLMLDSLRFSIETNLVVRGTTQVSNSANTLIRGQ